MNKKSVVLSLALTGILLTSCGNNLTDLEYINAKEEFVFCALAISHRWDLVNKVKLQASISN